MRSRFHAVRILFALYCLVGLCLPHSAQSQSRAAWSDIRPVGPGQYYIYGEENVFPTFRASAGYGWAPGVNYGWVHTKVHEYADGAYVRTFVVLFGITDGKVTNVSSGLPGGWAATTFDMATNHRNMVGDGLLYEGISGDTRIGTATAISADATWTKPKPDGVAGGYVNYTLNIDVVVNLDEQECDNCSTCTGRERVGLGSVDFSLDLGMDAKGKSGRLDCKSEIPSSTLASTAMLEALVPPSFEVIRSTDGISAAANGQIRHVRAATELIDLVTISSTKYEVRYYDNTAVGAKSSGLYTINGGALQMSPTAFTTAAVAIPR